MLYSYLAAHEFTLKYSSVYVFDIAAAKRLSQVIKRCAVLSHFGIVNAAHFALNLNKFSLSSSLSCRAKIFSDCVIILLDISET